MGGARERCLGRRDVADVGVDADVGDVVIEPRRAGRDRGRGRRHRLERLVVHHDALGRILGGGDALGHHHHHLLADVAHPVGRQQHLRRVAVLGAVAVLQRDIGRRLHRERGVRHGVKAVGCNVGAGQHRQHAGHGARRRRVDRDDARVRVRRAHEHRIGLTRQAQIIAVAAGAAEQAQVFLASERFSDRCGHGAAGS